MQIHTSKQSIIFLIALLLIIFKIDAQQINVDAYKQKYPGESKIILSYKTDYIINQTDDKISLDINKYEEELCLDENVVMQSGESVTFSGFFELRNLKAKTLIPNKSKYKTLNVTEFDTSDYRSPSVFYDDVKKISFKFPKLQPGAKTILEYTYRLQETRFVSPVYFNHYLPVESAEVSITFPANVEIGYKLFHCDTLPIDFTTEKKGANTIYRWKIKNVPQIASEGGTPDISYFGAHIFVFIKNYTVNGKKVELLAGPNELFNWYQNFINPVYEKPSPKLKAFVDSLVFGITDETEKVKKLFFWVQDNIKYIAFEAGNDGFIPREADLVFTRRYGDCKDMSSIASRMLTIAGIPANFVWIGTRHLAYSYYDLPLPACDNHMIAAYKKDGNWIFLDATTGNHPFGYPSDMIQGKDAMVHLGPGKYEITKIPVMPASANLICDTISIGLNGKKLMGKGVSHFKGYSRYDMYHRIANKDKVTQTSILKNYFEKGNNKFLIDNFTIENLDERDKDLVIRYTFNLSDYAQVVGNELFINLNMERPGQNDPIKDNRKYPIEADYKKTAAFHLVFEIPDGYKVNYLPENSAFTNNDFNYTINYKQTGNKIFVDHSFTTNFLLLPKSSFAVWNKMLEQVKGAYKESVNLTKISTK